MHSDAGLWLYCLAISLQLITPPDEGHAALRGELCRKAEDTPHQAWPSPFAGAAGAYAAAFMIPHSENA